MFNIREDSVIVEDSVSSLLERTLQDCSHGALHNLSYLLCRISALMTLNNKSITYIGERNFNGPVWSSCAAHANQFVCSTGA